jgi:hypothetical protein
MQEIGKTLIIFGVILIALGAILSFAHKIPFIGRLPGDILIQKKNFTLYFPLATSILVSIILSLIFWPGQGLRAFPQRHLWCKGFAFFPCTVLGHVFEGLSD